MKLKWLLIIAIIFSVVACKKTDQATTSNPPTGNSDVDQLVNMHASDAFNYKTDQDVQLDITILAPDNNPVSKIPIYILDKPEEMGGKILFTSLTDGSGKVSGTIKIPSYMSNVVVDPSYVGVIRNATVSIAGNSVSCTLGGSSGYIGNIIPSAKFAGQSQVNLRTLSSKYSYMGSYDNQGKPNYLLTPNSVISSTLLSYVNASLPEREPVDTYHPDYLSSAAETNVNITANADVYFTFVSEGAGYTNTIAYYTYPTGNPPQTTSAIDSLHIILPNASLNGSGGSLQSGNRVKLGTFNAGTSIGFALIANGWNGSSVGSGVNTFYSNDNLNPETQASLKRHTVLLYDNTQSLFLIGFEDLRRDGGSDNDFNDLVFYVSATPNNAISTNHVNPIDVPVDSDGDGVSDVYDKFPHDATRAYINEYPAVNTYGTLVFEDNWPYMGDYDLNDLVVGYHYQLINNGLNNTVQVNASFALKAAGSYFHNGFGVEFPFPASNVQSVTGTRVTNNQVVSFASNGCEAGQTKAVIVPFDDAFSVMNTSGAFNVYSGTFLTPDTTKMTMNFNTPLSASAMGNAPYNPFIIISGTRGRELHLPGYTPTQLANTQLFHTGQDNTNAGHNIYYKTTSNLPWGIAFPGNFNYPKEGNAINACYTKFINWVQSNGASNANWYTDSTNTVISKIYTK